VAAISGSFQSSNWSWRNVVDHHQQASRTQTFDQLLSESNRVRTLETNSSINYFSSIWKLTMAGVQYNRLMKKNNSTFNWKLLDVIIIWLKGSNWPWGLSRNLAWNANNFLRLYILFIIFVCVSKVAWRISFKTKSRWSDVKVIICFDVCVKELLRLLSFTMFYPKQVLRSTILSSTIKMV
jgi:hypothetical protein